MPYPNTTLLPSETLDPGDPGAKPGQIVATPTVVTLVQVSEVKV